MTRTSRKVSGLCYAVRGQQMACFGAVPLKIITEFSKEKSRHLRIEDGEALKPEGIRSLQPKSRSP